MQLMPQTADMEWWSGFILAVFLGWAISSYISSLIYRIPRGEYFFGRKPYCDSCQARLKPIDLAPIVSYLISGGKCRYCGAGIPYSYFVMELVYPLIFILGYCVYGFSDHLLLVALVAVFLMAQALQAYEYDYYSPAMLAGIAVTGALMKAMVSGGVLDTALAGTMALLAGGALARMSGKMPSPFDLRALPACVWLLAAAAIWLNLPAFAVFLGLWLSGFLLFRVLFAQKPLHSLYLMGYGPALLAAIFYGY